MTKNLAAGSSNDPWGLAPDDDVIGYTGADTNKVAMLFPKYSVGLHRANPGFAPYTLPNPGDPEASSVVTGSVRASRRWSTRPQQKERRHVVSVHQHQNDWLSPLGIGANHGKAQGTFFYTVRLAPGALLIR